MTILTLLLLVAVAIIAIAFFQKKILTRSALIYLGVAVGVYLLLVFVVLPLINKSV